MGYCTGTIKGDMGIVQMQKNLENVNLVVLISLI